MTLRLDGRVALVTGAGRGIGREHTLALAASGAAVVVNDLGGDPDGTGASAGPAEDVVGEIVAAGGQAVAELSSVATAEGAGAMVQSAIDNFGQLDMVVNNAGVTLADWSTLINVHLSGSFYVSRAAWPHLAASGSGRIVNTTSAAGLFGLTVDGPNGLDFFGYGAAKMGIVGLTRGLALEGRAEGIHVNAVAPVAHSRLTAWHPDKRLVAWMERRFPAVDIAPAVVALVHPNCATTGETFSVGGGRVARVFVGETRGLMKAALTAEDVLTGMDQINQTDGHFVPADTADEIRAYRELFTEYKTTSYPGGNDA